MMDDMLTLRLSSLNPHIVCSLCAGYLIDATTISECLHTYCKSCIVKHLQLSKACPQCSTKTHDTMPLLSLRTDRTMQDIVYKVVPRLHHDEEKRRADFYLSRGLASRKKAESAQPPPLTSVYADDAGHHYRHDEQISVCLEAVPDGGITPRLLQKFVRCSVRTLVRHVQQLLRQRLHIVHDVDVVCEETVLDGRLSLKHVWLSEWLPRASPMMLYYQTRMSDVT